MMNLFWGIAEDREDPLLLGRIKVRIMGVHNEDKVALPTEDLPWATPLQDCKSAAFNGMGYSATGIIEGSMVAVMFADDSQQIPIILGSVAGIPSAESKKSNLGFRDPNGVYPDTTHLDEPDTPRLASIMKIDTTIVSQKEKTLEKSIPVANGSTSWRQSPVPYNAQYPMNHVFQSESGHVMEFDDTPDCERINLHHKSGTFTETDHLGNTVEKCVGIRTIIVEKDELLYVKGSGHVNIVGDLSVKVGGSCQIEVTGDANMHVHGSFNVETDKEFNILAHGKINLKSDAAISLSAATTMNMTGGSLIAGDAGQVHWNSGKSVAATSLPVPAYNPSINIPAPVTYVESEAMSLEEDPASAAHVAKEEAASGRASPPGTSIQDTDTTPPVDKPIITGVCGFTNLSYTTLLSPNFTLGDLCKDGPFAFNGQNGLTGEEIACNLKQLCLNVLEPLFAKYGSIGIKINSGFRPRRNGHSQHELGMAVDIGFSSIRGKPNDRKEFFRLASEIKNTVLMDQLLLEYRSGGSVWIHISFNAASNRKTILTLNNDKTISDGLVLIG